ncbi:MAG: hypothetical protein AAF628_26570 [Planctomycetota bacterium]
MSQPQRSNRFTHPNTVELVLDDDSVSGRVEAVKELLRILDAADGVDAHAVYEEGTVTIDVPLGVNEDEWCVAFHLVWPEPQLNNQHLNTVKLMNWSAVFKVDFAVAALARKKALAKLRRLIKRATEPSTGPLAGRVRFVEEP